MFNRLPKRPYRVAIEGFSDFEREALASFFRLADRRVPAYEPVASPDAADFLIADADQPRVLDWIARERRTGETVFVGAQAPDEAVAWLVRPIEPVHIMRALDGLLGGRPSMAGALQGDDDDDPPVPPEAPSHAEPMPASKRRPNPKATPRGGRGRQVLVADDSGIARAFLGTRLRELGYQVTVVASGEEALATAALVDFQLVFLDIGFGDANRTDGLQVCQQLKQRASHPGGVVPRVVITTGSGNATDRVRGTLAGCDAYLTKPLLEPDLFAALRQVDPLFA